MNVQIALAAVELGTTTYTFWTATGDVYRASLLNHGEAEQSTSDPDSPAEGQKKPVGLRTALFHRPGARVTWVCAVFLLGYVGIEVALGGWIVEFMIQVRQGEAFASGMAAMGFWLGITVGRVILGFVTPRIGERLAITVSLSFTKAETFSMSRILTRDLVSTNRSTSPSQSDCRSSSGSSHSSSSRPSPLASWDSSSAPSSPPSWSSCPNSSRDRCTSAPLASRRRLVEGVQRSCRLPWAHWPRLRVYRSCSPSLSRSWRQSQGCGSCCRGSTRRPSKRLKLCLGCHPKDERMMKNCEDYDDGDVPSRLGWNGRCRLLKA